MTDKAEWASDVTNAIAGIASAAAAQWSSIDWDNAKGVAHNTKVLEKRKAVLEALLKEI